MAARIRATSFASGPSNGYLFFVLVLALQLGTRASGMQLELIQLVFRHGDRSSIDTFATNPCDDTCWPQGYGQLTQRGMRQHYMLGKYLDKTYRQNGFLNNSFYIHNQIYIRSTDVDRTLMSAEAQMSALYPPQEFQVFEPSLPWQPIPVHTVPKHNDSLLRAYDTAFNICPRYTEIYNSQDKEPYYQKMTKENEGFLEWLQRESKAHFEITLMTMFKLFDPIFCQAEHNLPQPSWLNDTVFAQMENLANFGMMAMFHSKEAHRLTAGLLVGQIRDNMVSKSMSPSSPQKAYFYSAHDTTVAALLNALELSNGLQPPYASAVIIELHSEASNYFFKVLYRNETNATGSEDVPVDLTPLFTGCNGKTPCPLDAFQSFANTVVPDDWAKECGATSSSSSSLSKETKTVIIAGFSIGGLLIVVLLTIIVVLCRRRMSHGYEPLKGLSE